MEELAAYFAVSPITIRRAIKSLEGRGALLKVYGGAYRGIVTDKHPHPTRPSSSAWKTTLESHVPCREIAYEKRQRVLSGIP